ADMAVAVQPQAARRADAVERRDDRLERLVDGRLPRRAQRRGHQVGREQEGHRLAAQPLDLDRRPRSEGPAGADHVDAADEAAHPLEHARVVEFRRAAATAREDREAVPPGAEEGGAVDFERRHHRHFLGGEFQGEGMLLQDLLVAPAPRAVELGHHDAPVVEPHLVDAVLVAVHGKEPPVALEADRRERVEDGIGRQPGVRRAAHDVAAGSVKPTRTPPSSFWANTLPPWNSAIRRTRYRPRPRWLPEVLRESRTDTIESKRLSPIDSGSGWPRLKTDSHQPATGRRPPAGSTMSRAA